MTEPILIAGSKINKLTLTCHACHAYLEHTGHPSDLWFHHHISQTQCPRGHHYPVHVRLLLECLRHPMRMLHKPSSRVIPAINLIFLLSRLIWNMHVPSEKISHWSRFGFPTLFYRDNHLTVVNSLFFSLLSHSPLFTLLHASLSLVLWLLARTMIQNWK